MNRHVISKYIATVFLYLFFAVSAAAQMTVPGHFVGDREFSDIAYSPDGKSVAIHMLATPGKRLEKDRFIIIDTETGQTRKEIPLQSNSIIWFEWTLDNRVFIYARNYGSDTERKFSFQALGMRELRRGNARDTIFLLDIETEDMTPVFEGPKITRFEDVEYARLLDIDTANGKIAVMVYAYSNETQSEITKFIKAQQKRQKKNQDPLDFPDFERQKSLLIVDIETGKTLETIKGSTKTLSWQMGPNFKPVMRIDEGEYDFTRVFYSADDTGKWAKIGSRNFLEDEIEFVDSVSNEQGLLVVMRPEGEIRKGLYYFNPVTGKTSAKLYEHPQYDLVGAYSSKKSEKILFASWWDDTLKRHWIDDAARQAASDLDTKLRDQNWFIIHMSEDETIWKIAARNPAQRTIIYSWDTRTKTLTPVAKPHSEPSQEKVSKRTRIDYAASDGLALRGYLTAPDTDVKALIVMPHGGPVSRDNLDYDGWAQFLASSGYAVFQPNFRGGDGRGLGFEEKGHQQWGRAMQTDIEDGVKALLSSGHVTSDTPRYIIGASYGGYAALTAAFQYPDRYSCAASINGVSDLPAFLDKFDKTDPLDKYLYDIWVKRMGDPQTQMDDLISISPHQNVDKIKARLFVLHGKFDDIVPYQQSETFVDSARKAGKQVKYIALSDLDHNRWSEKQSLRVLSALELFILRCDSHVKREKKAE